MAHAVETMAYAGEVPWHGLGVQVKDNLTPQEMLVAAELDWTVSKRHLFTHAEPDIDDSDDLIGVEGYSVLVRDSDNKTFGPCGPRFIPSQNADAFGFFKKFTEAGHMKMETAGSLKGGEQVWGLANISEDFTLPGDDRVLGYLLVSISHMWGKSNEIRFTPIRVVCNNTLTMALSNKSSGGFRMPHVRALDTEVYMAAEEALGLASDRMSEFKEAAEFLSSKKFDKTSVVTYIADLFQPELLVAQEEIEKMSDTRMIATRQSMVDEFKRIPSMVHQAVEEQPGANLKSSKGTWWGAMNAVTFVVDHKWGHDRDASLHNAWFGGRASLKKKAMTQAIEYAKAA
jgi:phage/plasmid-like protein (TIGR03299 family)|tara:strand:+ start:14167 stop:15195 length:1029 start_codon:yes stop_codon:yes gene_type:complete